MPNALLALLFAVMPLGAFPEEASPGDGLGLAPGDVVHRANTPGPGGTLPPPLLPPASAAGATAVAIAGAAVVARRRRHGIGDVLFVYVSGHGGSQQGFADLGASMGVEPSRVVAFDYREAWPVSDPHTASEWAPTAMAADALDRFVRSLHAAHIYLVGHSKGGAVVTELVAQWDRSPQSVPDAVIGAALLDPPIAAGILGDLQSAGWALGPVPDDGGFDPIRCDPTGCYDVRRNLGKASGVEVIAVRNPAGWITNFRDEPDGLRVYDLVDDGGGSPFWELPNIPRFVDRITDAHESVLHDDAVATCIAAEAVTPGSCAWQGDALPKAPIWGRGTAIGRFVR